MDKAKQAVSGFLHKDGKHDTTVHETVNPAVTNEKIQRTQHDEAQTVIDREVHQDHHHTSIQPIAHKEVLPEEHKHRVAGVEHREINHGDSSKITSKIEQERSQFKDTREVGDVHHTHGATGAVLGEHVHHHVHENIQPVIQKETIQPSVVHTTVPIHEVHKNEVKHHSATQLPAVTMDEFQKNGGKIKGREERVDSFAGEPRQVNPLGAQPLGGRGADGTTSLTEDKHHNQHGKFGNTGTAGTHGTHSETEHNGTLKKPSLMDKLNPKVDANGDGKAGFMK